MSESEKFEAQGRAFAALKLAKSNVATIKTKLLEHSKRLEENASMLRRFAEDPTYKNPHSYIPASENVKAHLSATPGNLGSLIDELVKQTEEIRELQEQIEQF